MKSPRVADIKRNALDDGPGIRTVIFFKGCPLACVWCHNPESILAKPELLLRSEQCIACGDCWEVCEHAPPTPPSAADKAVRGMPFSVEHAWIDRQACTVCGACVDACPAGAREIVGQQLDVDTLAELVMRDRHFYANSGGGLTLSGGEATLYPEFAGALAKAVRGQAVHVLLETCGEFEWEVFAAHMLPSLDTIYFDLKLADADAHQRYCGRGNARILANLAALVEASRAGACELLVRVPLVPDITATAENLKAIAAILRAHAVGRVALLPYNPLWVGKARGLGRGDEQEFEAEQWMTESEVHAARAHFEGFQVLGA